MIFFDHTEMRTTLRTCQHIDANHARAMEKLPNELLCDVMRCTEESSKD